MVIPSFDMPIIWVYTGADGVSHMEEIQDSIAATDSKKVTDLRFLRSEAGSGQRLNAPYGHYDITLSGADGLIGDRRNQPQGGPRRSVPGGRPGGPLLYSGGHRTENFHYRAASAVNPLGPTYRLCMEIRCRGRKSRGAAPESDFADLTKASPTSWFLRTPRISPEFGIPGIRCGRSRVGCRSPGR